MNTLEIQRRLTELGYNPGPLDGAWGVLTRAAVIAFQRARGLKADGIVGALTVAVLFNGATAKAPPPPWFELALRKKGLHEERDYTELTEFLRSDGKTLGDPRKYPWCGELISTCMALTVPNDPQPANPYLARNWLTFGEASPPTLGAIAVFWRGARAGVFGHVGFVAGQGEAVLYILGGNQANTISIAPLVTSRLLGCRWPSSAPPRPIRLPVMTGGKLSTNEA